MKNVCIVGMFLWFLSNCLLFAASSKAPGIADLKDPDPSVRRVAIDTLAEQGNTEAIDSIMQVLKDDNSDVRSAAVTALGVLKAKKASKAISDMLLKDPVGEVRQLSAISLGSIGDTSVSSSLVKALSDTHIGTKLEVIKTLGKLRIDEGVDPLIAACKDKNPLVREYAAASLSKINAKKAIPAIEQMLSDDDYHVKEQAATSLGIMSAHDSIPKLKKLLQDPNDKVKLASAFALGRLHDNSGLQIAQQYITNPDQQKKRQAVEILGLSGTSEHIPLLENIQKTDENASVRNAAKQAINFIKQRTQSKPAKQ